MHDQSNGALLRMSRNFSIADAAARCAAADESGPPESHERQEYDDHSKNGAKVDALAVCWLVAFE
jgi:hypothetical protein